MSAKAVPMRMSPGKVWIGRPLPSSESRNARLKTKWIITAMQLREKIAMFAMKPRNLRRVIAIVLAILCQP